MYVWRGCNIGTQFRNSSGIGCVSPLSAAELGKVIDGLLYTSAEPSWNSKQFVYTKTARPVRLVLTRVQNTTSSRTFKVQTKGKVLSFWCTKYNLHHTTAPSSSLKSHQSTVKGHRGILVAFENSECFGQHQSTVSRTYSTYNSNLEHIKPHC